MGVTRYAHSSRYVSFRGFYELRGLWLKEGKFLSRIWKVKEKKRSWNKKKRKKRMQDCSKVAVEIGIQRGVCTVRSTLENIFQVTGRVGSTDEFSPRSGEHVAENQTIKEKIKIFKPGASLYPFYLHFYFFSINYFILLFRCHPTLSILVSI